MAVYIANTFYLTSHSIVPVMRDKDIVDKKIRDHNLIIVGESSFAAPYFKKVALTIGSDQSISLGKNNLSKKLQEFKRNDRAIKD